MTGVQTCALPIYSFFKDTNGCGRNRSRSRSFQLPDFSRPLAKQTKNSTNCDDALLNDSNHHSLSCFSNDTPREDCNNFTLENSTYVDQGSYGTIFRKTEEGRGSYTIKVVPNLKNGIYEANIIKHINRLETCKKRFLVNCFHTFVKDSRVIILMEDCEQNAESYFTNDPRLVTEQIGRAHV